MRICIINLFIDYKTIPVISSIITSLSKNHEVHLLTVNASNSEVPQKNFYIKNYPKLLFNSISPFLIVFRSLFYAYKNKYDFLISVDPQTIIPGVILGKLLGIKLIYISLEIFVKEDKNNIWFQIYYLQQRFLLRFFDVFIALGEARKELLIKNSSPVIIDKNFFILPNSTLKTENIIDKNFLHKRLGISSTKKILLIAGEIGERSYVKELSLLSRKLPEEYVIVVHARRKVSDIFFDDISNKSEKFIISNDPVEPSELDSLFSSAYIGLVLYKVPLKGIEAENVRVIDKSSGKANNFLKVGIPIIMTRLKYFEYIGNKYECGVCINSVDDIINVVSKISTSYEFYSKNALGCFDAELKFESNFEKMGKILFEEIN